MKLLLDTHIWLWGLLEPERLTPAVAAALEAPDSELWLSPVSIWETLVLAAKGKITLHSDPADWVERQLRAMPMNDAQLKREVAILSRQVDLPHQDPADRFLAATALVYDLTLVTADRRLLASPTWSVLANDH